MEEEDNILFNSGLNVSIDGCDHSGKSFVGRKVVEKLKVKFKGWRAGTFDTESGLQPLEIKLVSALRGTSLANAITTEAVKIADRDINLSQRMFSTSAALVRAEHDNKGDIIIYDRGLASLYAYSQRYNDAHSASHFYQEYCASYGYNQIEFVLTVDFPTWEKIKANKDISEFNCLDRKGWDFHNAIQGAMQNVRAFSVSRDAVHVRNKFDDTAIDRIVEEVCHYIQEHCQIFSEQEFKKHVAKYDKREENFMARKLR